MEISVRTYWNWSRIAFEVVHLESTKSELNEIPNGSEVYNLNEKHEKFLPNLRQKLQYDSTIPCLDISWRNKISISKISALLSSVQHYSWEHNSRYEKSKCSSSCKCVGTRSIWQLSLPIWISLGSWNFSNVKGMVYIYKQVRHEATGNGIHPLQHGKGRFNLYKLIKLYINWWYIPYAGISRESMVKM